MRRTETAVDSRAGIECYGYNTSGDTGLEADKASEWRAGRDAFQRSLDVWKDEHPARMSATGFEVTPPALVARKLAECDRAIQPLRAAR